MTQQEHVPAKPYISLRERIKWRRLLRFYAEEVRHAEEDGDTGTAKIYRQSIASVLNWIADSESE
jgi:hypothetical protein